MFREIIAEREVQTPDLEQINASSPPPLARHPSCTDLKAWCFNI